VRNEEKISYLEAVATNYHQFGYRFVQLVREEIFLTCSLDIVIATRPTFVAAFVACYFLESRRPRLRLARNPSVKTRMVGFLKVGKSPGYCPADGLASSTRRALKRCCPHHRRRFARSHRHPRPSIRSHSCTQKGVRGNERAKLPRCLCWGRPAQNLDLGSRAIQTWRVVRRSSGCIMMIDFLPSLSIPRFCSLPNDILTHCLVAPTMCAKSW
jgi:hypothetical protein